MRNPYNALSGMVQPAAMSRKRQKPVEPIIPGNLPMGIRQQVKNPDGSISTVRTISIGTDQGEVVIPTVIGGRVVSDEEAIRHFEQTGENFGIFRTIQDASTFAKELSRSHGEGLKKRKPK